MGSWFWGIVKGWGLGILLGRLVEICLSSGLDLVERCLESIRGFGKIRIVS